MSHKSYYEKGRDLELWWENHRTTWLENFKKSTLYEDLKGKFSAESLEKGLEHLAIRRTSTYRYGPKKMLNEQREMVQYVRNAFQLIESVQAKKIFNLCMRWRAEQVKIPGVWHTYQLRALESNVWSTTYVTPFSEEDLEFVKHLLTDEVFINTREGWKYFHTIPSSEITSFRKSPDEWESIDEFYPLVYQLYDDWFGTGHLLDLPDIRKQKEEALNKVDTEQRKARRESQPSSEPSKPYLSFEKHDDILRTYFRNHEPADVQRLLEADDLFFPDQNITSQLEYEIAFEEIMKEEDLPYPSGDVNWLDATVYVGRKIFFARISLMLDMAYCEYKYNLENGIPMTVSYKEKDVLHVVKGIMNHFIEVRQHLGLSTNTEDF